MNWRIMIQSVGAFLAAFALIACASAQPSMDDAAPKIVAIGDCMATMTRMKTS